jgi:rhamnosyltransferase
MHNQPKLIPKFAVILAAYNGKNYIEDQINSILKQKNIDITLYISVDKSIDGTETFLENWSLMDVRIQLLPYGEKFSGAAPNFYRLLRDLNLSKFDYLSYADQDDIWHSSKLWNAYCMMVDQGALGYSSNITAFWTNGKIQFINKAFPQRNWDFLFESAGPGCTYVLHKKLFLHLQKLVKNANEKLLKIDYHDWLTYAFARINNYPWIIDSWSSILYRQHANNQLGVNFGFKAFFFRVQKILNGYGLEQTLLISDLVDASSLSPVKYGLNNGSRGYMWLALHANQCRRKRIDQIWFFIYFIIFAIINPFIKKK